MTTYWIPIWMAMTIAVGVPIEDKKITPLPALDVMRGQNSFATGPDIMVIRDRQGWASLWASHMGGGLPNTAIPTPPVFDFENVMIVALTGGETYPTGDYIYESGRAKGKNALIRIRFVTGSTSVLARPFAFFAVPRVEGEVVIETPTGPKGAWAEKKRFPKLGKN